MRLFLVGLFYLTTLVISTKAAAFNIMRLREISNSTTTLSPSHNRTNPDNTFRKQDTGNTKWVRWFPLPLSDSSAGSSTSIGSRSGSSRRSGSRLFAPSRIDNSKRSPTPVDNDSPEIDGRPTPEPTGDSSPSTTVHITDTGDFSLILPKVPGELIGDAESDGVSYCSPGASSSHCVNQFPDGFVTAAALEVSDGYIQITGCIDPSRFHLDPMDTGGQFDVRYPNGAQCSFGGYGASFIELVEPAANRFCIRCCSSANDQDNCNSHQDRMGCINAIPGVYDFPDLGVSCG